MDEVTNFPLTLIDVTTKANLRLLIGFKYSDGADDYTVLLERGVIYDIVFLKNGKLNKVTGKIIGVSKLQHVKALEYPQTMDDWLIRIDASSANASLVVDVVTSQLRRIKRYVAHMDEDNTITNGTTHGGTTHGDLHAVVITDVKKDSSDNITDGKITDGKVGPATDADKVSPISITEGGCTDGKNASGNDVVVTGGQTTSGTIVAGTITSGHLISYTVDETTGDYKNCVISYAVVNNSTITGGTTTGATIIDPTMTGVTVTGGTITGSDMVAHGVTVTGNIGINGYIEGGTNNGGTATGDINGNTYTIINGVSTGGRTTGATIYGGVVTGGTTVGNAIIGATVTGGSAVGGTTVNATIKIGNGIITPGSYVDSSEISNPVKIDVTTVVPTTNNDDWDGLIIFENSLTGIGSNISTVNL